MYKKKNTTQIQNREILLTEPDGNEGILVVLILVIGEYVQLIVPGI